MFDDCLFDCCFLNYCTHLVYTQKQLNKWKSQFYYYMYYQVWIFYVIKIALFNLSLCNAIRGILDSKSIISNTTRLLNGNNDKQCSGLTEIPVGYTADASGAIQLSDSEFYCKISYLPVSKYNRYKIVVKFGEFTTTASGIVIELLEIDEKRTLLNFTEGYSYCGLNNDTTYTFEYINCYFSIY